MCRVGYGRVLGGEGGSLFALKDTLNSHGGLVTFCMVLSGLLHLEMVYEVLSW
jgi:hypothetical protein